MNKVILKTPAVIDRGEDIKKNRLIAVNLYDTIYLTPLDENKIQIIKKKGYKIHTNDRNLSYRVAFALKERVKGKKGVRIEIDKTIPPDCGFLSQASNATGVLIALNRLWETNLNKDELITIAKATDPLISTIIKIAFSNELDKKWPEATIARLRHIHFPEKLPISNNDCQKWLLKHFPDLKEVIGKLKENQTEAGFCGNGPGIYALGEKNSESMPLTRKADFIWKGKTCTLKSVFTENS